MPDIAQLITQYKPYLKKYGVFAVAGISIISILIWGFPGKSSAYSSIFKLYFVLFILMGLGFYLARVLKGKLPGVVTNTMRIVEKLPLEPGVSLYIIEKDTEELLVGVGNKQITFFNNGLSSPQKDFSMFLEEEQN